MLLNVVMFYSYVRFINSVFSITLLEYPEVNIFQYRFDKILKP